MGIFSSRRQIAARTEPRLTPVAVERRDSYSSGWSAASLGGPRGATHLAENLSAVLGAVELISSSIASLPVSITVDTPGGRIPAPDTAPAWRLLSRPNTRQSWPAFITTAAASVLLDGNSVSALTTDGRGAVTALTHIPFSWLSPQVIQSGAGSGARLVFDLSNQTAESVLLGLPRRLLESDVLHIRGRSEAGVIGRSVLSRAPQVLAAAAGVADYSTSIWENGAHIGGMLAVPPNISADGMRRLESSFTARVQGTANAGRPLIVDQNTVWTPLTINPGDAEVLASRRFSVADIARLFCIPEPMLQTGVTAPATLTPYLTAFAQLCLAPLVAAIEAEFDHAVLPAGQHLAVDMSGLLRGDFASVAAAQAVLVQSRIATPNDARRALALPAIDGGDTLGAGPAPSYPADAAGVPSLAPKPGPGGGPLPNTGTNQNQGAG